MERFALSTVSLNRVLLLVTGGGFVFLFAESIIEHSPILAKELIASFPILFSLAGAGMNLIAAYTYKREHISGAAAVNGIGIAVGFVGLVLHNLDRFSAGSAEHAAPILAPLAFTGLSLVGLLACLPRWRQEEQDPEAAPPREGV